MCDSCNQTEAPNSAPGYGRAGMAAEKLEVGASNFRERLEARRNRLTRQLVEVEEALKLVYTNPDAERIHEVLNRSGV